VSWVCPNREDDHCKRLNKKCIPSQKGCVLEEKVRFIELGDEDLDNKEEEK